MDDNQGVRPSADDVQNELTKQQQEFDEVLPEDQEHGDIDELHENVTGVQNDSPVDEILGEHDHEEKEDENDDTPRPEEN